MQTNTESRGTFICPVCGHDTPHKHPAYTRRWAKDYAPEFLKSALERGFFPLCASRDFYNEGDGIKFCNHELQEFWIAYCAGVEFPVAATLPASPAPTEPPYHDGPHLTIEECIAQFRMYASGHPNRDARHQLNFCADFLRDHGPVAALPTEQAGDVSFCTNGGTPMATYTPAKLDQDWEQAGELPPLPVDICFSESRCHFYRADSGLFMDDAFYDKWRDRADEFPSRDAARAVIAARQAPTVQKLDYDLLKLTMEQTQERLRQAEEAIAKRDATALRVAQCAGEFARDAARPAPDSRDAWPEEPTPEMQAAGAQAIRFDTTTINKMWTANAVYRAMRAAQEKAQ